MLFYTSAIGDGPREDGITRKIWRLKGGKVDVTCLCGEPWDTYHMRHDALYDTILEHDVVETILTDSEHSPLDYPGVREAMAAEGWKFAGNSLYAILHCPCCPKGKITILHDAVAKRQVAAALLEGDEDGIAAFLGED